MTRILSTAVAAAALLASTGLACAQTTGYSTNDRSMTTRSSQPSSQFNRMNRTEAAPTSGSTTEPRSTMRQPGAALTGNQFASETEARSHCAGDTVVWVNTKSHVYHFPGSPEFGHTKRGAFMCQADADRSGTFRAAKNEMRNRMPTSGNSVPPRR